MYFLHFTQIVAKGLCYCNNMGKTLGRRVEGEIPQPKKMCYGKEKSFKKITYFFCVKTSEFDVILFV